MAENYTLSAVLELKDKFSSTINNAKSQFKNLDGEVNGFKNSINQTSSIITNSLAGIAGGITVGSVANFLKESYMGYVDLNEQLIRNSAITGANSLEQEKLKNQVTELGATTKFTALEVAKAQMYQAMAGYKTNEILEVTPTLLKLAIATGEDLAATSDMVTDNLSAFGLKVQDVNMFADILASTANNTNTSVSQLGMSFKYVGTVSAAMGEDMKEVAIMLGLAADNGIKAEQAGTGLRGIYSRLANPTEDMRKQLEKTNSKLYEADGSFIGLRKVIEEAKPALEKMTAEQRNQWLATVAGTEGMSIWSAIMNSGSESVKKVEKAVYEANGALDTFTETMSKTDKQKIDELASAFDGFKNQIGEALSPIILKRMERLTNYINELNGSDTFSVESMSNFFETLDEYLDKTWDALYGDSWLTTLTRITTADPLYLTKKVKEILDERPVVDVPIVRTWEDERKDFVERSKNSINTPINHTPLKIYSQDESTKDKALDFLRKNDFTKKDFNFNIKLDVNGLDTTNKDIAEKVIQETMQQIAESIKNVNTISQTQ